MRFLRIPILLSFLGFGATSAWGQFGLYGSPEVLRLPQSNPYGEQAGPVTGRPWPLVQATSAADPSPSNVPLQPGPPNPQGADMGNQLPDESGCGGGPGCGGCGDCNACDACDVPSGPGWRLAQAQNRLCEFAFGSDCGHSPWYASALALVMGRNTPNRLWTSYETGNNPNQLPLRLSMQWRWGGEIRIGRRFCCDRCDSGCDSGCDSDYGGSTGTGAGYGFAGLGGGTWAVEATYWTLDAFQGLTVITHASTVSTPLVVSAIEFAGVNGTVYFDSADEHRISRRNEVHNIEVSLVKYSPYIPASTGWDVSWLAGLRFFRFEEDFLFASLDTGFTWGEDGGIHQAYLNDHIVNNLIGFQLGFEAGYNAFGACRFFVVPKFGIYGNHITNRFNLYRGDGVVANPTAASGVTGTYPVNSTRNVVSFLAQIDVGLDWQFAPRWAARVGYRAVVATEMGLADEQIPIYVVDIPEIAAIDSNADLILHGAFLGLTYNF